MAKFLIVYFIYIYIYIYIYLTYSVQIFKNSWPRVFYTRGQMEACILYTWPLGRVYKIHVAKWTCVYIYVSKWPCVLIHVATRLPCTNSHVSWRHVAIWPRGYSNSYCRHAANYMNFCSVFSYLVWDRWGILPEAKSEAIQRISAKQCPLTDKT